MNFCDIKALLLAAFLGFGFVFTAAAAILGSLTMMLWLIGLVGFGS